jgi:hypothetical protein
LFSSSFSLSFFSSFFFLSRSTQLCSCTGNSISQFGPKLQKAKDNDQSWANKQTNKQAYRQKKNRNLRTAKCFQDNYHHFVLINFVQVKRKYLQIHSLDFWFTFPLSLSLSHLKK